MNNQYITVNLIPNLSAPAVACVSQYDVGRPLVFRVYNGVTSADLTGVTAVAVGTKKSGLGFSVTGTISGNTVTFSTTLEMTQESGMIPAEIRFSKTGENIGTANFTLAVEPSPHLEGTTDGTTETMADLQNQLDALDERVEALEGGGGGLTQAEKQLILTLFCKAAYAEDDAGVVYDALEALWATTTRTITYNLSHVSSSNTTASIEQGQSYATTLTASTNYTINSVSVTMGGVDITSTAYSSGTVSIPSVTGNIVITATAVLAAQSITATYTQSGTVYDTDSLDSLKADLVVTANYAGGTTETVPASNYTLSGTLTVGTSTITVTYGGLTDTFSVTVTSSTAYVTDGLIHHWDAINNTGSGTHDSTATSWADLVGSKTLTKQGDGATSWDSNALVFTGVSKQEFTNSSSVGTCEGKTIEIVMTPSASQTSTVADIFYDSANTQDAYGKINIFTDNTFSVVGKSGTTYSMGGTYSGVKSICASYTNATTVNKAYVNGVPATLTSNTHSMRNSFTACTLGSNEYNAGLYRYNGRIHAIRIYNRVLTDAEVAQNYAVDVQRFGLS